MTDVNFEIMNSSPARIEIEGIKVEPNFDPLHIPCQIKFEEPDIAEVQLYQPACFAVKSEIHSIQDVPIIPQNSVLNMQNEPQFVLLEDQCILKEFTAKNSKKITEKGNSKGVMKKLRGTYGKFICDLCGMRLVTRRGILCHMICRHIDNKRFICKICGKKFIINARLQRHMRQTHSSKTYNCSHCKHKFKFKEYLETHIIKWHLSKKKKAIPLWFFETKRQRISGKQNRGFECKKCSKLFLSRTYLKIHQKSMCDLFNAKKQKHIGLLHVACKICHVELQNFRLLKKHVQIVHNNVKKHKCDFCFKEFTTITSKNNHVLAKHVYIDNNFKCKYCEKYFKLPRLLRQHIKHKHEGGICYCCHCSYSTRNKTALGVHIFRKHLPQFIKMYECKICSKKYKNEVSKRHHDILEHSENKTFYSCDICDYKSLKKYNLSRHNKNNKHLKRTFKQQNVKKKDSTKMHEAKQQNVENKKGKETHKAVNKISVKKSKRKLKINIQKCNYCTETFNKRIDLLSHIRVVHKSDDYTCKYCKQVFETLLLKTQHMKICVNKYRCSICSQLFDNDKQLNLHSKKEHKKDKTLQCDVCKSMFINKAGLKNHKRTIHKLPQYNCTLCLTICETNEALQQHLEEHNKFILGI